MASEEEKLLEEFRESLLKSLGKRIQTLREQKGMSQIDLAARMIGKFDTTNISRIESGRTNPTILTLCRIAKALEVSVNEFMNF